MTASLIVMLIWGGSTYHGGPAVVQGFDSMAACRSAQPVVEQAYRSAPMYVRSYTTCVDLSENRR